MVQNYLQDEQHKQVTGMEGEGNSRKKLKLALYKVT